MKSRENPMFFKFICAILIWGGFFLLFSFFRSEIADSIASFFEIRNKAGADFNTDSAVINYLLMSNSQILTFVMFTFAAVLNGLILLAYALNSKIKVLESELSEIKSKLDV